MEMGGACDFPTTRRCSITVTLVMIVRQNNITCAQYSTRRWTMKLRDSPKNSNMSFNCLMFIIYLNHFKSHEEEFHRMPSKTV